MNAVARLKALLGLDTKEFKAGVRDAKSQAGGLSSSLKVVGGLIAGAFSVGAVVSFGKSLLGMAGTLQDMSDNLDVSVKSLAGLSISTAGAGVDIEKLTQMLGKLQGKQADVARGDKKVIETFEQLGISVDQVIDSDPIQLFEMVAQAASKSGVAVSVLGDIFGEKLGNKTLNLMKEIAENGIPEISDATAEAISRADELGDRWEKAMQKIKLASMGVILSINDAREGLVDKLSDQLAKFAITSAGGDPNVAKEIDEMAKERAAEKEAAKIDAPIAAAAEDEAREKRRVDALRELQNKAKREELQKQIDANRDKGGPSNKLDAKSLRTDSMREMGGLVGRDISMMPVFERNARAAEMAASTLQRVEALQRELVALGQSQEWSR